MRVGDVSRNILWPLPSHGTGSLTCMKFFRIVLVLPPLLSCAVFAQPDADAIPDFSSLDEYFYLPKTTLSFGFRALSGAKTSFSGHGSIAAPESPDYSLAANISRTYHDGLVSPDGRSTTVDNGDGTTTSTLIASDGKTNTWSFTDLPLNPPVLLKQHPRSSFSVSTANVLRAVVSCSCFRARSTRWRAHSRITACT